MLRISTQAGLVDLDAFSGEDFDVQVASSTLAHINRFGGQAERYSVAQHSLLVASLLPDDLRKEGLLHDVGEVYVGDIIGPLKERLKELHQRYLITLEDKISRVIHEECQAVYGHSQVHEVDKRAAYIEARFLFPYDVVAAWGHEADPTGEEGRLFLKFYKLMPSEAARLWRQGLIDV